MPFTRFYHEYKQRLIRLYPSTLSLSDGEQLNLEFLVSPYKIKLPKIIAERAEKAIRAHCQLVQSPDFLRQLAPPPVDFGAAASRPEAVLTAYDFHTTESGEAYLVEINTNAAAYLLSVLTYEAHGLAAEWKGRQAIESLRDSFLREAETWHRRPVQNCVIVDEDIPHQKMLVEFLMYQDWLASLGWKTRLQEAARIAASEHELRDDQDQVIDFIYNRLTDFYFENSRWLPLAQGFRGNWACISPNPWAYHLLADKARLVELSQPGWLEKTGASAGQMADLRQVLIPTFKLSQLGSNDEIWARRKNLFFKPRRSHGGKSVYRGSSVSRKVFERIVQEDTLVQEYVPAQSWQDSGDEEFMDHWKFDLRFYVYGDQIQLAVARCYQGQVTNFGSRFGGLAAVEFS